MKRITFPGGSIVTGSAVADALLTYVTELAHDANSVSVEIPVLEANGAISTHTLLIGPASQLDIADVNGLPTDEEIEKFPVPSFPQVGMVAVLPSGPERGQREREADAFDQAVAEIHSDLDAEQGS